MRVRYLATCMAVATLSVGVSASSASAATTTFDMPVTGPVVNDCTGESFFIDGTAHVKSTDNSTLSGIKYQVEMNQTGVKGTTATGVRYVMNQQSSDMSHAEFDAFGNVEQTLENTMNLTRQGESGALVTGDDFRLHVLLHLTVSNGITRANN